MGPCRMLTTSSKGLSATNESRPRNVMIYGSRTLFISTNMVELKSKNSLAKSVSFKRFFQPFHQLERSETYIDNESIFLKAKHGKNGEK